MPIRQRFADTVPVSAEEYKIEQHTPSKPTFDPRQDAYVGSELDKLKVPEEVALAVGKKLAYIFKPLPPRQMKTQDLLANIRMCNNPGDVTEERYRNRIRSPLTGIRAFCVECSGGSPKQATMCDAMECPLWPFRLGQNSFYSRK